MGLNPTIACVPVPVSARRAAETRAGSARHATPIGAITSSPTVWPYDVRADASADGDHSAFSHPDHIGSNDYFAASVEVVTHENTRKWMAANPRVASNPVAMPDRTFTDRMTLGSGDDRIELYYFGAGHTDGDAFIVFPARRAMAAGDIFAWKMAPLIDPMAGGSVLALPDTLEKAVNGIPNVDTVIEGHGDVNTWEGFRDYVQFNRALVDAARAGLGQKNAEEIAESLPGVDVAVALDHGVDV